MGKEIVWGSNFVNFCMGVKFWTFLYGGVKYCCMGGGQILPIFVGGSNFGQFCMGGGKFFTGGGVKYCCMGGQILPIFVWGVKFWTFFVWGSNFSKI